MALQKCLEKLFMEGKYNKLYGSSGRTKLIFSTANTMQYN